MLKISRLLILISIIFFLISPCSYASDLDDVFRGSKSNFASWLTSYFNIGSYGKSYALLIGISNYNEFSNLGTHKDAIDMKDFLINEAGFDYVRVITGKKANLERISYLMVDEFPKKIGKNDRFLFYWSGHGVTRNVNGRDVGFLPVSTSSKNTYSSMLNMKELSEWDKGIKAKQTLYLLDACFSGLAGYQSKSDSQRNLTIRQIAKPSRQILTAGLKNEETLVINGKSIFTEAVIEGLRGGADTETNGFVKDGIVSLRELELFVKQEVAKKSAQYGLKIQTPLLTRLNNQEGDFFFISKSSLNVESLQSIEKIEKEGIVKKSSNNTVVDRSSLNSLSATSLFDIPKVIEKTFKREGVKTLNYSSAE